uniref:Nudix hydrolase 20, chloroplastic-like n=1 Tax=Hirondellea gigas TaxID=1518452 RepID=A0A2P2I1I7_9CRUS
MVVTNGPVSSPVAAASFRGEFHDPMMDVCMSFGSSLDSIGDHFFKERDSSSTRRDSIDGVGGMGSSPSPLLQLLWKANSFLMQGLQSKSGGSCTPLLVGQRQVGILRPEVRLILTRYPSVFTFTDSSVVLNTQLKDYDSRTKAVAEVLQDIRASGETVALRSWRGENFVVWGQYGSEPLFEVERSAVVLLGIRTFGVHITGYVSNAEGGVTGVWLQKRAENKPTYPGMMDTMVGGGLTAGLKASEVLYKEAAEEASIPSQLVDRAQSAGTVSFFAETERGLHANTEYVFEIELPPSFEPQNSDGEVQGFVFVEVKDIMDYLLDSNYKLTSTPILIDFLIRHGVVSSYNVPDLPEMTEMLHCPLTQLYRCWPVFPCLPTQPTIPNNNCLMHQFLPSCTTTTTATLVDSRNESLIQELSPRKQSFTASEAVEQQRNQPMTAERGNESYVRDESDQEDSDVA